MRIIFLCGSLEQGRDGVGDYTRRLAGELIRQGHQVALVALKEPQLGSITEETQVDENIEISVIRIPTSLSAKLRLKSAQGWIKKYDPELISLQYVPYSFSKKGMPLILGWQLRGLNLRAKWHVMVHEPYLGFPQKGLKNQIVRLGQKLSLRFLKSSLTPVVFHTSNPEYQRMLFSVGIESAILGLFGNILIGKEAYLNAEQVDKKKVNLTGIYFGSAPRLEQHLVFAKEIKDFCDLHDCRIKLILCGKSGALGDKFTATIKQVCEESWCEVISLGKLSFEELSHLFSSSDFGIARIPPKFLGKSGSAISMLEHGLPLWVPLGGDQKIEENFDFRTELCFRHLTDMQQKIQKATPFNRLPSVAKKFLADLHIKV